MWNMYARSISLQAIFGEDFIGGVKWKQAYVRLNYIDNW